MYFLSMEIIFLCPLSEEILIAIRTVDLRVADRTVLRPNACLRVRPRRDVWVEFDILYVRMAFEAELSDRASLEHLRVVRTVR